jgi:hypothetical protein
VHLVAGVLSAALIASVLWDAFETVLLPRTVSRRLRLTRLYFRGTWRPWRFVGSRLRGRGRDWFLSIYGPFSLLGLTVVWAVGLIVGFAGVNWAVRAHLAPIPAVAPFVEDLYLTSTSFITLGLGDVQPVGVVPKMLVVAEACTGFGLLALVLAYFPVLYQSFSQREARLTMLDAWAGSPPAAAEVLRRLALGGEVGRLTDFLKDWEYWCSALLESHISYPFVALFRSQHGGQSWLAALATLLDLATLVEVGIAGVPTWQAHVTFAIARHAVVDLSQVFHAPPDGGPDRLSTDDLEALRRELEAVGLVPARGADADRRLLELRRQYEPYLIGLARTLMMTTPPWSHHGAARDNWRASPRTVAAGHL